MQLVKNSNIQVYTVNIMHITHYTASFLSPLVARGSLLSLVDDMINEQMLCQVFPDELDPYSFYKKQSTHTYTHP